MRKISSRYVAIQSTYDDAKTWDMVLVKLDHLTDREPNTLIHAQCKAKLSLSQIPSGDVYRAYLYKKIQNPE